MNFIVDVVVDALIDGAGVCDADETIMMMVVIRVCLLLWPWPAAFKRSQ